MTPSEQDRVLGALLDDKDLQRHFTTSSRLQKLKESIEVAAEFSPSFIIIRDDFKRRNPGLFVHFLLVLYTK